MARSVLFAATLLGVLACAHAGNWTLLFGMSSTVQFESLSTYNAAPVQQGQAFKYTLQGQGLSSLDATRGVYYIIGLNDSTTPAGIKLVGISTDSGMVISETPLPFAQEFFVGVGQYVDVQVGTRYVLCVGPDVTTGKNTLYQVNPVVNTVTALGLVGSTDFLDILGGTSVYDPSVNIEWVQFAMNDTNNILFRMYGYDANDGTLLNMIDNNANFGAMAYDSVNSLVYGIGAAINATSGKFEIGIYTFNSATTVTDLLVGLPQFTSYMSAEFTVDYRHRVGYGFFTNQSAVATDYQQAYSKANPHAAPMSISMKPVTNYQGPLPGMMLVAIDIDTGLILSQAQACAQFPDCPWSIEYQ
jgi:hypothetical protein